MTAIETGLRDLLLGLLRSDPEVRAELAALVAEAAPTPDALLSVAQAAATASCSPATIRRAISAGALRSTGAGKMLRVARRDLDTWLASSKAARRPAERRQASVEEFAERDALAERRRRR